MKAVAVPHGDSPLCTLLKLYASYQLSTTNLQSRSGNGYIASISGSSMLRFFALKLMPINVTGRLPPL